MACKTRIGINFYLKLMETFMKNQNSFNACAALVGALALTLLNTSADARCMLGRGYIIDGDCSLWKGEPFTCIDLWSIAAPIGGDTYLLGDCTSGPKGGLCIKGTNEKCPETGKLTQAKGQPACRIPVLTRDQIKAKLGGQPPASSAAKPPPNEGGNGSYDPNDPANQAARPKPPGMPPPFVSESVAKPPSSPMNPASQDSKQ